jgi:predicted DNA-binding transcriptional regulator YafY
LPPSIKPGVFEQVSAALFENRWLEVDYLNADRKPTKAQVMPLGLAQQGTRLYLVCRFHGYSDDRTLALHRLQAARTTTLTFDRPMDFDLQRFDDEGRFGLGQGKKVRLTFRVTKEAGLALVESPLSKDQIVEETATYYRISAMVVDSGQLDWWLRSWGNAISTIRKQVIRSNRKIRENLTHEIR